MENGEDEEDETLEGSFEEQPERPVQLRTTEHKKSPPPEGRAPTMTIELVRVGRPKKVLAILAVVFSMILFVSSFASTSWIFTATHRIGLLQHCLIRRTNTLTTQEVDGGAKCFLLHFFPPVDFTTWYSLACLLIGAAALLFTLLGIVFFLSGTFILALKEKAVLYKAAIGLFTVAVLLMVTCLILFPIGCWLWTEASESQSTATILIGWPVYVACIGTVLLVLAITLLAVDRKSEEVAYKEVISRA